MPGGSGGCGGGVAGNGVCGVRGRGMFMGLWGGKVQEEEKEEEANIRPAYFAVCLPTHCPSSSENITLLAIPTVI